MPRSLDAVEAAMSNSTKIRGDRWFAWFSANAQQWLLKHRVHSGKWEMHRVPREVQERNDADRYCRIYVKAKREKPAPRRSSSNGAISDDMTFRQLGDLWTTGRLASMFPRYVRQKKSADDDESRLRLYVYDHIGDTPIRDFAPPKGLELAERVMASLPGPSELSNATARHVAQTVHRVLGLAVYPLRILEVHPLPRGFMPRPANDKAKSYIYPDENAKLMCCKRVPLVERLFYGFLTREGARVGEIRALQLYELDLQHGWGHLDETKNGRPKDWPLSPGTLEALKRYRDRFMRFKEGAAHVFARGDGTLLDPYEIAENLRRYLRLARVERPQLYLKNRHRLQLRAHDLRASFVTVALANGRTESWVADRTGHLSSQMINRYKRWARGHAEQNLGDWVPLHEAIPELSDDNGVSAQHDDSDDADAEEDDASGAPESD
jgi:integrase